MLESVQRGVEQSPLTDMDDIGCIDALPPLSTHSFTTMLACDSRERAYFSWTILDTFMRLLSRYCTHVKTLGSFGT